MSTTKTLDGIDFMMMDVHRPLTEEDINEINPQAAVDKTLGAGEEEHGGAESVGSAPSTRCDICFAPMPCANHANVEVLDVVTSHPVSVETVLAGAHNAGLDSVVVVGIGPDGKHYFASSEADAAEAIYALQRGIWRLNRIADGY